MHIQDVNIPSVAKEIFLKAGYETLYPPQEEAIKKGVLTGKNFVLASPTASGKTLIAEFCALKHVLEKDGKVLYLTPLRALASEKFDDFQKYVKLKKSNGENLKIVISTGDYDSSDPWLGKYDIIISTNEKCDSLLRHRAHWMQEISLVVADEVHLLHDAERGPTLEVTLARLKQINPKMQFLALSATISNVSEIAEWLEADYVATNWRPVPLKEGVLLFDEVSFNDGSSTKVPYTHALSSINLALKTVKEGGQALIFAETRKTAVNLAQKSAALVKELLSKAEKRALKNVSKELIETGEKTRLSEILARLIESGVAAHHAGIYSGHRKIIENNFRKGLIKLLVATPTLAAGVNLPARTVVINNYLRYEAGIGRMQIPVFEYKQMAGRAGRPRFDSVGEAVLIAKSPDESERLMEEYVCAGPERIWSKLKVERALRFHVLATVAADFARSEKGLFDFFNETFFAHQYGENQIKPSLYAAIEYLVKNDMIKFQGKNLFATEFGKRVSELYIDPESAVIIKSGLNSRAPIITEISFLHLISHTPDITPRYYPARREMEELELFLNDHRDEFMFEIPEYWKEHVDYETFLGELKCVSVLLKWIDESKEDEILEYFRVEPGDLYRLIETADWLLYATYELAKLFKHRDLLPKIYELRVRVANGVKSELIPLVALEGVGRIRARALFNSGYKTIEILKHASISDLLKVPGIGPQMVKKIKEQVGGFIKKEEIEKLKAEKTEQKTLTEF